MRNRIWLLPALLASMAMAKGGTFNSSGSGSDGNPYLIEDLPDLRAVGSASVATSPHSTYATYRLANDIVATDSASFASIARNGFFAGKLHGGGHKIIGLSSDVGLFWTLNSAATVDSLILVSPKIVGRGEIGAFAARNGGTIKDCQVLGGSVATSPAGQYYVGGVVGVDSGLIQGVFASDSVQADGDAGVGGIAGLGKLGAIFRNVTFAKSVYAYTSVGGIVGQSDPGLVIDSCANTGSITATGSSAGGIVGWTQAGTISHCSNSGTVKSGTDAGGIVGTNGVDNGAKGADLFFCRNSGKVQAVSYVAGGLIGLNSAAHINSCYNTGDVATPMDAGGLVGYIGGYIYNSFNSGRVTTGSRNGGGIVGGWLGKSNTTANRDSIVNCYNSGRIDGAGANLGGAVGWANLDDGGTYEYMANTYSVGYVANTSGSGGLIGNASNAANNVIVNNCYWDSVTSGWRTSAQGAGGLGSLHGLPTDPMFAASTFYGWDTTLWRLSRDSSIYPGFKFLDNAPFAFNDTIETTLQDYPPAKFLKNDRDIETGRTDLIVKVLEVTGGTVSSDSSSIVSFPNTANNHACMVVLYRVGEARAIGDTLWGNQATATLYYVTPWKNAYYALYSGKNLTKDSLPVLDSLIPGKTPAIVSIASTYPGVDSTATSIPWADAGQEHLSSNGFSYVDSIAYVTGKATSHIVARLKPTYSGDSTTINTLLTEGFFQADGYYPNIRVSYSGGQLRLELITFTTNAGEVTGLAHYDSVSRAVDGNKVFGSGGWLPVHLIVHGSGADVGKVELYLGGSADTAASSALSLTFDATYFSPTKTYGKRVVQVPQYEASPHRTGTEVDNELDSWFPSRKGLGGSRVGDFAMIASPNLTRKDMVTSYFDGWKRTGAGTADTANYTAEISMPLITQILYGAPGDQSTTSCTATASKRSTLNISNGFNASLDVYGGYEKSPDALTNSGGEIHIGAHSSVTMNFANSFALTTSEDSTVSTNATMGDVVVTNVLKTKNYLLERPRMRYLFADNLTDAQKVFYIGTIPDSSNAAEQVQSVRSFIEKYRGNDYVMANFLNLYAKDTATGLVRTDLLSNSTVFKKGEKFIPGCDPRQLGQDVTSERSATQSLSAELGTYFDAKGVYMGWVAGTKISFNYTRSQESSATNTNVFHTDATISDDDEWDQLDVAIYYDTRWGVPVYVLQKDGSFTSGPHEALSNPTTIVGTSISEDSATACLGDTLLATLTVSNNSSASSPSTLVDSMQFYVALATKASGVYSLLSIQPSQFTLARGGTQKVVVKYQALDTTSIPVGFVVQDGYARNQAYDYLESSTITGSRKVRTCSPDGILQRPVATGRSNELAANIARSFASLAQGTGTARIGTDLDAGDAQTVDILLPSAANVRTDIYDNLGTRVISWSRDLSSYDLANLDATGDGRWVLPVSWNGRASDGTAVSAGVYLWKIVVRTDDGRKLETVKKLGLR